MKPNTITQLLQKVAKRNILFFLQAHKELLKGKEGAVFLAVPLPEKPEDNLLINDFNAVAEMILKKARVIVVGFLTKDVIAAKTIYVKAKVKALLIAYLEGKGYEGNYDGTVCTLAIEDEEKKLFGGGILTDTHAIACSNFPPDIDQKFVISIALNANDISPLRIITILKSSQHNIDKWEKSRITTGQCIYEGIC